MADTPQAELDEIADDFDALGDDWEERYRHLIDLGKGLAPMTDAERSDANKVRGCASQVWLAGGVGPDGRLDLRGDSDAHIVRGLVAGGAAPGLGQARERSGGLPIRGGDREAGAEGGAVSPARQRPRLHGGAHSRGGRGRLGRPGRAQGVGAHGQDHGGDGAYAGLAGQGELALVQRGQRLHQRQP